MVFLLVLEDSQALQGCADTVGNCTQVPFIVVVEGVQLLAFHIQYTDDASIHTDRYGKLGADSGSHLHLSAIIGCICRANDRIQGSRPASNPNCNREAFTPITGGCTLVRWMRRQVVSCFINEQDAT